MDDALNGLREGNASLRTSFKTFSEGGNFSSFEVSTYRDVIVALESRIDEAESMIVEVLNKIEGEKVCDVVESLLNV